ncbi:MAG: YncE family protein [Chloroflexota bacterium]|nr:MAG: YncE family protein [Chloroflexota bacterium]
MIRRLISCLIVVTVLPLAALLDAGPPTRAQNVVSTITVGASPDGVAVNPTTNLVYVANSGSNSVSVINGTTRAVVATIAVGTNPKGVAANPNTNRIYVTNLDSNNVSVIDGASNAVAATVAVGTHPFGVAVNPTTNRIYVGNADSNSVSVIDGSSNTVLSTISFAAGPAGIAVNPATNRIYVITTGAAGVLSVIDGSNNSVITTLASGSNSAQVTVNPVTNRFYVTNTMIGNVSVFDGANNTFLVAIPLGPVPTGSAGVGVNPTTNHIYATTFSEGTNSVSVIDGASNAILATLPGIGGSGNVAANPATNTIYVTTPELNDVAVIEDALPPNTPPQIDARIEIVFPHDQQGNIRSVSEAPLVNVAVFLFDADTRNPVPCSFSNAVTLRWALNLVGVDGSASQVPTLHEVPGIPVSSALGTRLIQTVDGVSFPVWIFNDVPVPFVQRSDLFNPAASKQFFVVNVADTSFRTNVWSHGQDPRTFFPAQFQPQSASQPVTSPLDSVIQVVFPHAIAGNVLPVNQAPLANVAADVFTHPLDGAVDAQALQSQNHPVRLRQALNSNVLVDANVSPVLIQAGPNPAGLLWPRFVFNNVDVSAAQDLNNKYFFAAQVGGIDTHTTIWSHGAEARTIFPVQDVPARSGAACGG